MTKRVNITEQEEILRDTLMGTRLQGKACDRLINMGYLTCPASAKYHGAVEGGLMSHSIAVTELLCKRTLRLGLKWKRVDSPIIVGMLHDLCKLGTYTQVADSWDCDGATVNYHYEYTKNLVWKEHGELSVIMALQLVPDLTEEEMLCIRYHMGAYQADEWNEFDAAIHKYPNVLYTHLADMGASKIMGR